MSRSTLLIVFIGLLLLTACARHVVIKPEAVAAQSGADWTIKTAPSQTRP